MFFKLLEYFLGVFYFLTNFLGLITGIYFIPYSNCNLMGDVIIWLIIISITSLLITLMIVIIKTNYKDFSFLKLTFNPILLQDALLDEDVSQVPRNISFTIFFTLCFFFVIWIVYGTILCSKSFCNMSDLQYFFYYILAVNCLSVLFGFSLITRKILC